MLDRVRQTVPATRTLSDGRLTAVLLAGALLVLAMADVTVTPVWVAVIAGVWLTTQRRRSGGCASRLRTTLSTCDAPATRLEDPLVARARALRDRTAARV